MRVLAICACGLLILVPLSACASLVAGFNPLASSAVDVLTVAIAAWALVSLYLMLDARRLLRVLGRPRQPHTDPAYVAVSVLGSVNFLTCTIVLILNSFR